MWLIFLFLAVTSSSQDDSTCNFKTCIRKCCDKNSVVIKNKKGTFCVGNQTLTVQHPILYGKGFGIIHKESFCNEYQFPSPAFLDDHALTFFENGSVAIPDTFWGEALLCDVKDYCADHFNGRAGIFVCLLDENAYLWNQRFMMSLGNDENICRHKKCIRKCCDKFISMRRSKLEVFCENKINKNNNFNDSHPFLQNSSFHILYKGYSCNNTWQYAIELSLNRHQITFFENNVSVQVPMLKSAVPIFDAENFCFEHIDGEPGLFVCISKTFNENRLKIYHIGMIISMPFLLVTFLAYAILPDRNLHQRALMFYVLTLLISYILLVTINLSENLSEPWCALFGYFTLYFFMVSFFWMNVICFDIWYTFSGGRGFVGSKRTSERKRLLLYSLYAFGVPLLLVLLVLLLQTKVLSEESVHNPGIGVNKCFVADGWPNLWYFYLEAGILVIANIIFFVLTALKIRQAKKETSMLKHTDSKRHSYEKDEQIFNLYVKLLFAMGVNWSMEVISWLVNWSTNYNEKVQYIWWVTDFFNACYGVFIFFMFVFKKKIWRLLQRRYYNFIGKPHLAHTMTTTIATGTSHYSSTNYSTADTAITDRSNVSNGNGRTRPEQVALRSVS